MKHLWIIITILFCSFTTHAYGDIFKPRAGLPPEQLTVEVRLARLYDFLCASDDYEARQRAASYYDEDTHVVPIYSLDRPRYAAEEYLRMRGWRSHPENYWIERNVPAPTVDKQDYLESIGQDLYKDAVHRNTLLKEIYQTEQTEKVLQEKLIAIEKGIQRKSSNARWATLLFYVGLLGFFLCVVMFILSVRKLNRLKL